MTPERGSQSYENGDKRQRYPIRSSNDARRQISEQRMEPREPWPEEQPRSARRTRREREREQARAERREKAQARTARQQQEGEGRRASDKRGSRSADARDASQSHSERHGSTRRDARNKKDMKDSRHARTGKTKRHRPLKIALITVLVVCLGAAGVAFAYYFNISGNLHRGVTQEARNALVSTDMNSEPFYVLLMGTDESAERDASGDFGDSYRTDSMILARIDPVEKKATLVSLHRDTLVDLGEYGECKLNEAHAYGGAALAVQTVSDLADVPISHYAEIDFDAFKAMVDAVGGIEVDVPVDIDDPDAGGSLSAGYQTLNGEQALILCQSRNTYSSSTDPDAMRAANQRLVLTALANKILNSDVATIANMISEVSQYVTTDLEVTDIIGVAQNLQGIDPTTDIYTGMQPVTNKYVDGGWYSYTDEDAWKTMMERVKQGLPPTESTQVDESTGTVIATAGSDAADDSEKTASVRVLNGTNRNGLAEQAANKLKSAGFVNVSTGNANATNYQNTVIVYDTAAHEYEAELIAEALGQGTCELNNGDYLFDGSFLVLIGADWSSDTSSS